MRAMPNIHISSLVLQFPAQEVFFSEMWLDFWPHRRYLTTHIFWQLWKRHILILDLYFFVRGEDAARHQPALLCVWYLGMENIWYWLDDFEWIEYGTEVRSSVSMPRALVQPSLENCLGHVVLQLVWSTKPCWCPCNAALIPCWICLTHCPSKQYWYSVKAFKRLALKNNFIFQRQQK